MGIDFCQTTLKIPRVRLNHREGRKRTVAGAQTRWGGEEGVPKGGEYPPPPPLALTVILQTSPQHPNPEIRNREPETLFTEPETEKSLRMAPMLDPSGRGTTRAENAQGTPNQSHISPSILVYEDESNLHAAVRANGGREVLPSEKEKTYDVSMTCS